MISPKKNVFSFPLSKLFEQPSTDAMRYRMGKFIRQISRGGETGHETAAYQNQHTPIQMTLISSCHLSKAASMSKSTHFLSDDSGFDLLFLADSKYFVCIS